MQRVWCIQLVCIKLNTLVFNSQHLTLVKSPRPGWSTSSRRWNTVFETLHPFSQHSMDSRRSSWSTKNILTFTEWIVSFPRNVAFVTSEVGVDCRFQSLLAVLSYYRGTEVVRARVGLEVEVRSLSFSLLWGSIRLGLKSFRLSDCYCPPASCLWPFWLRQWV